MLFTFKAFVLNLFCSSAPSVRNWEGKGTLVSLGRFILGSFIGGAWAKVVLFIIGGGGA